MWMNQKIVFLLGTWVFASLREYGGRRQEGGRESASDIQCLGHGSRESGISGRGWAGQGNRNGEKGKNKAWRHGTGGECVKWGEGEHTGSALGEESKGVSRNKCVMEREHSAFPGGMTWWVTWVILVTQSWFQQRMRHDPAKSVRNHCTSRGQEGNSPAFHASLGAGCRPETWSPTSCTALLSSCSASSGCDMFVSGAVEYSCSWNTRLSIFSRCFTL